MCNRLSVHAERKAHYTLYSGGLSVCTLAEEVMEDVLGYRLMQPHEAAAFDQSKLRRTESCAVGDTPVWVRNNAEGMDLIEVPIVVSCGLMV